MAEIKWIKVATDIFEDEKILLIESLPEADSIIVIWFKLLSLAGKVNNSGVFIMNDKIAYTEKMLATIFRRKEATIALALKTFEKFGMIELVDGVITIPNWGKYQKLEQFESKREYQREYMREYREKQKKIACKTNSKANSNTNGKANVRNADIDIDKDKEIEGDKEKDNAREKEQKHRYGEYKNVLLTDEELEKLKERFPQDWERRIEDLSLGIESKGYKYKSHYAAILSWARRDEARKPSPKQGSAEELDDFYKMVADWAKEDDG